MSSEELLTHTPIRHSGLSDLSASSIQVFSYDRRLAGLLE